MAEQTGISWADATFNPWMGCSKVSPGCAHCYAETLVTGRMGRAGTWGDEGTRERTSAAKWREPLRWNRLAADGYLPDRRPNPDGHRPRIFCASLADVFEPRPELEGWRRELFDLIAATENLDWLVLTKRPEFARDWLRRRFELYWSNIDAGRPSRYVSLPWTSRDGAHWGVHPNVWMGVSVENSRHTWRADVLREIPAAVRFISAEPLLGSLFAGGHGAPGDPATVEGAQPPPSETPVREQDGVLPGTPGGVTVQPDAQEMTSAEPRAARGTSAAPSPEIDEAGPQAARGRAPLDLTGIDWVIVGGESGGRNARPMHPDWARELRDACLMHPMLGVGAEMLTPVAFHFKQWGSWEPARNSTPRVPHRFPDGALMEYRGPSPKSGGKLLDGVDWCEFPTGARDPVPA